MVCDWRAVVLNLCACTQTHTAVAIVCVSLLRLLSGPVAEIIEDELEEEKEEEERLTELASTLSLDSSDITEGVEEDGDEGKGKPPEQPLEGTSNGTSSVQGSVEHKVSAEQATQEERQGDGEKEAAPVTEVSTVHYMHAYTVCVPWVGASITYLIHSMHVCV